MTSDRVKSRSKIAVCVAAALFVILPASGAGAGDSIDPVRTGRASDPSTKTLQLDVGKSVIIDLPEEAGEIYVGEPKIANAIVRSARRVYISGVANGQTSIFALARDGRKIATIEVSVGRDVGELSALSCESQPKSPMSTTRRKSPTAVFPSPGSGPGTTRPRWNCHRAVRSPRPV
jgi:Flp pilus assembly secretin CpaC